MWIHVVPYHMNLNHTAYHKAVEYNDTVEVMSSPTECLLFEILLLDATGWLQNEMEIRYNFYNFFFSQVLFILIYTF